MTRRMTTLGIAALLVLAANPARAALIWQDEFARPSNSSVGNGWIEVENDADDVGIVFNDYLLLRDKRPDGSATHPGISTLGYENITVEFRWRPWSAESEDRLRFSYQALPELAWSIAFDTGLGGTETYRTETVALDAAASDTAALGIAFAIDATASGDAAKIAYVRIYGDAIPTGGGGPSNIDAPASLALMGFGLLGLASLGRRH